MNRLSQWLTDRWRPSRPTFRRMLQVAAAVGVALALSYGAATWWLGRRALEAARPAYSGDFEVAGLTSAVEIFRDSRGIPHIEAGTESDGWLALGFVHAQDRLGQMLWMRRLARGRAAEVLGVDGLPADQLARALGIGLHADAQAEALPVTSRAVLEAYAQGVNARLQRIARGEASAPIVGGRVALDIDPWTVGDSLALVKLVAWATGGGIERPVILGDILQHLGSVAARPFFPSGAGVRGMTVDFDLPASLPSPQRPTVVSVRPNDFAGHLLRDVGFMGATAWVLSSDRTSSGAPYLVADVHVAPTAPSLLYQAHVRVARREVVGASVPGVPVFWWGRNPDVAWASTPAHVSTLDLYHEEIRRVPQGEGEPARIEYRTSVGWIEPERREEVIRVRGPAVTREVVLEVQTTRHGPLVHEFVPKPLRGPSREPLAVSWAGAKQGDGVGAFLAVMRATSGQEVARALEGHHEPGLAVVYADTQHHSGMRLAGWFPRRGLPAGSVPVYGRQVAFDWLGPVDPANLPAVRLEDSPDRSRWLIVADNALASDSVSSPVEWQWRTSERAERVEARLSELTKAGRIDLKQAASVQADVRHGEAREVVESILTLAEGASPLRPEAEEIVSLLRNWDGESRVASRGAAAYHVAMDLLIHEFFGDPVGRDLLARYLTLGGVRPERLVGAILRAAALGDPGGGWTDAARVRRVVAESLRMTWFRLTHRLGPNRERWSWGRLHTLSFRPFSSPDWWGRVAIPPIPVGGDGSTLAQTGHDFARPFDVTRIAGYRMAVDLATSGRILTSLVPGQSEHRADPHFDDGLTRWLEGRSSLLVTQRLAVEEDSVELLVLHPAP